MRCLRRTAVTGRCPAPCGDVPTFGHQSSRRGRTAHRADRYGPGVLLVARRAACFHPREIARVIEKSRQASASLPDLPCTFYLRADRREMFAPYDPGPVAMVAMDSPSVAMKRPKVGPPITVRLPVQSALTE